MKILFDYWMRLSLRVILLFTTAMLVSFSPFYFRGFFGDSLIVSDKYGFNWDHGLFIDDGYKWGFRHYLFQWMCIVLFFIQAIRTFLWAMKNEENFIP